MPKLHYTVLIVGAGTGGIMTAAQLRRARRDLDIAIIDSAEWHAYQAAWTLVGAGTYDFNKTRRRTASLIPRGVDWIRDRVVSVNPEANSVDKQAHPLRSAFRFDANRFGSEGTAFPMDGHARHAPSRSQSRRAI